MNKEEFLQTQDSTYLKYIEYIINALETLKFINIEYTDSEINTLSSDINISFDGNFIPPLGYDVETKKIDVLISNTVLSIVKDCISIAKAEAKNHIKVVKPYMMEGHLDELLSEYISFDENKTIISNGMAIAESVTDHVKTETLIPGLVSYFGKIRSSNVYIDPFQRYTDSSMLIVQPNAITLKIRELFNVSSDSNSVNSNIDIVLNPEFIEVLNFNVVY